MNNNGSGLLFSDCYSIQFDDKESLQIHEIGVFTIEFAP